MNYAFAGLVIDCDIALPELAPASAPADCVVRSGHIDWLRPERVVHTWRGASGSTAVLTIARRGDGFTLQFGETARFLVGARGESIVVEPASIDSSATLRHRPREWRTGR